MWDKAKVRELLMSNDRAVERAVMAIFRYQTTAEQSTESTREHNGVGFNATDAMLLSSFAKQCLAGRSLSQKQMDYARKKILKYSGQLARIANSK